MPSTTYITCHEEEGKALQNNYEESIPNILVTYCLKSQLFPLDDCKLNSNDMRIKFEDADETTENKKDEKPYTYGRDEMSLSFPK